MTFLWNNSEVSNSSLVGLLTPFVWPLISEQRQHTEALPLLRLELSGLDCHALCRHFLVVLSTRSPAFPFWLEKWQWRVEQSRQARWVLISWMPLLTNESKQKQNVVLECVSLVLVTWWARSLNESTTHCRLVLSKPSLLSSRISEYFLGGGKCHAAS